MSNRSQSYVTHIADTQTFSREPKPRFKVLVADEAIQAKIKPNSLMAPDMGGALHADFDDRLLLRTVIGTVTTRTSSFQQKIADVHLTKRTAIITDYGSTSHDLASISKELACSRVANAIETKPTSGNVGLVTCDEGGDKHPRLLLYGVNSEWGLNDLGRGEGLRLDGGGRHCHESHQAIADACAWQDRLPSTNGVNVGRRSSRPDLQVKAPASAGKLRCEGI